MLPLQKYMKIILKTRKLNNKIAVLIPKISPIIYAFSLSNYLHSTISHQTDSQYHCYYFYFNFGLSCLEMRDLGLFLIAVASRLNDFGFERDLLHE